MPRPPARKPARSAAPRRRAFGWLALDAPAEAMAAPWLTPAAFAVVAITGAILLAIVFGPHRVGDYFTETDFYGAYADGARLLQRGQLDPSRYTVVGPLYEVTLAAVGYAIRDLFVAGQLLSVAAACATLVVWFALLRRRVGAAVGLWTALFLAANPTFLRYGYSATTDALATFLQAAALFALLGLRGRRAPLWSGALSALAVLTRYNAVYLVPGALVCYLWLERPEGLSRRWAVGLYLAGFAALAVPWLLVSFRSGQAPGTALFHNIAYDVFARARGITWDEYQARLQPQFRSLWDVVRRDPPAVAHRELQNLVEHFRLDLRNLLGWPAAGACLAGLLLALRDGSWRRLLPVWLCGALLFLTLVPAFYSERYSLPLAPVYLALAGVAAGSPALALLVRPLRVPLKWALALWPLWLSGQASYAQQAHVMTQLPVEVLPAAEALRRTAPAGERILARKPHIAYYSGLRAIAFPSAQTLPQLAAYCREHDVRYLYFSWPEAETRPEFSYLLDTSAAVPGLELLTFVRHNPAAVYRIGADFGREPEWLADPRRLLFHRARAQLLIDPMDWGANLAAGLEARDRGDFGTALSCFLTATRTQPRRSQGWLLAGEAYANLQRYGPAGDAYAHALELDPGSVDARVGLGWVYLGTGQPNLAAEAWRPVISKAVDPSTLKQMAALYQRLGDPAAAAAARARLAATVAR